MPRSCGASGRGTICDMQTAQSIRSVNPLPLGPAPPNRPFGFRSRNRRRSRPRTLGILFGNRGHARHAAVAPFSARPPQEPALQQLGVEPVGFRSAMLPRYRDTRGMDHVSLYSTRRKPARQPKAVAAGFEGKRNPGDRAPAPDRLIPPAMQQANQPFWARLQLLAWLTLNPGKHAGNSQLDWLSSMTAMIVLFWSSAARDQLKSFGWGIAGTPSIRCTRRSCHFLAAHPIASLSVSLLDDVLRTPVVRVDVGD